MYFYRSFVLMEYVLNFNLSVIDYRSEIHIYDDITSIIPDFSLD